MFKKIYTLQEIINFPYEFRLNSPWIGLKFLIRTYVSGGTLLKIQQRINKARGAFSRLKNVWRASNISLHLKIKLFNACVKSVLLYGCETWFVTNKTTQKLQVFVNRCLRNILGIWWPEIITNQELWEKTGQSDINVEIKRRKLGWIGHTLRKIQSEICHSVLEWNPQGKTRVKKNSKRL